MSIIDSIWKLIRRPRPLHRGIELQNRATLTRHSDIYIKTSEYGEDGCSARLSRFNGAEDSVSAAKASWVRNHGCDRERFGRHGDHAPLGTIGGHRGYDSQAHSDGGKDDYSVHDSP